MNGWFLDICLAILLVWSVVILASVLFSNSTKVIEIEETTSESKSKWNTDPLIGVLLDGKVEYMPLDEYLTGVLLCEIPSDFHEEAKKAQAIVARTYAARVAINGDKHGIGIVCGNAGCCQGFIDCNEYVERWSVEEPVTAARNAVLETHNLVITYRGELIDATYFSCSGGQTEGALEVWGSDVPYLQSVSSPGEEKSVYYLQTMRMSPKQFCDSIGVQLTGDPSNWFGACAYTTGGGVKTIRIGNVDYTGTKLRNLLGLPSTIFSITAYPESIIITTKGYGHRVGMSQYGADAMAVNGSDFSQIIEHYYSDVDISSLEEDWTG